MNKNILLIMLLALTIAGCASKSSCPKNPALGNLGSIFNSADDEYSPFFYNDVMYFTATSKDRKKPETIYRSEFRDGRFTRPQIDTTLPFRNIQNAGLPVFWDNPLTGKTELYFAAVSRNGKVNRNLFFSERTGNRWSQPKLIQELNTPTYESHPTISSNGNILVFSSDREGSKGGIDLFASLRNIDGTWGAPRNLTEINTERNEISPFIAQDGTLYFASQGYNNTGVYDIVKAEYNGRNGWQIPRKLPFPINTDANENGPAIFRDRIFVASNRRGGCGGIDLYAFQLCGPVLFEGIVASSLPNFPLNGRADLYDGSGKNLISSTNVGFDGVFRFELQAMNDYIVRYQNDCSTEFYGEKTFSAYCSDSNVVVIKAMFDYARSDEIELTEVKVPFFVSGYYMPNTRENLESLRLKFAYNLIGTDETTRFIEKPGEQYDGFVIEVENSLLEAAESLYSIVEQLRSDCLGNDNAKLTIHITGFADPRSISSVARFPDADILDERFQMYVERGQQMDNLLLSKLRAYYTAKYFENFISNKDKTGSINSKLNWKIEGKGVDATPNRPDNIRRRVNIKITPSF